MEIHFEKFDTIFAVEAVVFSVGIQDAQFGATFQVIRDKSADCFVDGDKLFPVGAQIQNDAGIVFYDFF